MSELHRARRRWTEGEDNKLRRLVSAAESSNGDGKQLIVWRDISTAIGTRNANQCRERWVNHLRPGINRGDWTKEEDDTIQRLQKELGNAWTAIASKLNGRTDIDTKNRWHKLQRIIKEKRRHDECEDAMNVSVPKVGMKVLVKFAEDGYNKLYDGTITAVEVDNGSFLLQIQYEDGSFENGCRYPDDDIYLVDCCSKNDGLTEEEVSLSSELLNIFYSLKTKKQKMEYCDNDQKGEVFATKENYHVNLNHHIR